MVVSVSIPSVYTPTWRLSKILKRKRKRGAGTHSEGLLGGEDGGGGGGGRDVGEEPAAEPGGGGDGEPGQLLMLACLPAC